MSRYISGASSTGGGLTSFFRPSWLSSASEKNPYTTRPSRPGSFLVHASGIAGGMSGPVSGGVGSGVGVSVLGSGGNSSGTLNSIHHSSSVAVDDYGSNILL
jgi:hypothetical protein